MNLVFALLFVLACIVAGYYGNESDEYAYHVLIDSGSTGSRVYIYRYLPTTVLTTFEEVAHKRVRPALSTFFGKDEELKVQIQELIDFAYEHVDHEIQPDTNIALQATAGLRIMPQEEQDWLIEQVQTVLESSKFLFHKENTRVLTGGEEALFALLATNIAYSNITDGIKIGAGDLGGSSQQIALLLPKHHPIQETVQTVAQSIWDLLLAFSRRLWAVIGTEQPSSADSFVKEEVAVPYSASACPADYRLFLSPEDDSSQYVEIFARSMPGLGLVEFMQHMLYSYSDAYLKEYQSFLSKSPSSSSSSSSSFVPYSSTSTEETRQPSDNTEENAVDDCEEEGEDTEMTHAGTTTAHFALTYDGTSVPTTTSSAASSSTSSATISSTSSAASSTSSTSATSSSTTIRLQDKHNRSLHQPVPAVPVPPVLTNPCLPPGERYPTFPANLTHLPWEGTGHFDECVTYLTTLLHAPTHFERTCLHSLPNLPQIIAVDNFPKVLEVMDFSQSHPVAPRQLLEAGRQLCARPWPLLLQDHPEYVPFRAHQACFGAAYIYTMIKTVYGIAEDDPITFFPTEIHHSFTIGWPLGSAVLSAMNWRYEEVASMSIFPTTRLTSSSSGSSSSSSSDEHTAQGNIEIAVEAAAGSSNSGSSSGIASSRVTVSSVGNTGTGRR